MDCQLSSLKFDSSGLIPAIVQDASTGDVLMMAWMNRESLRLTVDTGRAHYWSRSRGKLWLKGESSGHVQVVKSLYTDCDRDCLLLSVEQTGAACHDGYHSCFYRRYDPKQTDWIIDGERVFDPKTVYP